jgi:hypothetical protein
MRSRRSRERAGWLSAALRWGGTLVVVGTLVALGLVSGLSTARAADPSGYNQMTGAGVTASQITVNWDNGLLGSGNQPLTTSSGELNPNADRSAVTGTYSFEDPDYSKLAVTVSQTQDIGHGGITVSWSWPDHTTADSGGIQGNYLQMMECYGSSPSGPSPEDCMFGEGTPPVGAPVTVASRVGFQCTSDTISVTNPNAPLGGGAPNQGCDPTEPTSSAHYPCTNGVGIDCVPDDFSVPFVAQNDPTTNVYQPELSSAFDQFSTNEVDVATTGADGTGQQQFETLTSTQALGLGCGQEQTDGTPQGCWLVIVPRGHYEPNGFAEDISAGSSAGFGHEIVSSPLSAGNWAQRIQVHLSYAPLPTFCPTTGIPDDEYMEGSQLALRAVDSWELELNQQSNCARLFHMASTSEQEVTQDFTTPDNQNALAFTTDPIGTDRSRAGLPPPTLPGVVYAPVAVVGLDFAFHIDERTPGQDSGKTQGYLTQPVNLSPQLVARAITQSYLLDLPDYDPAATNPSTGKPFDGPAWAQANPQDISFDPTFEQLNPEVISHGYAELPLAPLETDENSAYNQDIWQWMQGDPATSGWLDGTAKSSVTIDPQYESQKLGAPPAIDNMPRAYTPCLNLGTAGNGSEEIRCSTDELPYVTDFDTASADVLAANPLSYNNHWDPLAPNPNNTTGYWDKNPPEPPGQTFEWAMDDTSDSAAYGLVPADLCNDSGGSCVAPTIASVGAAVAHAKPDKAGLLEVNPADPGTGAYPLSQVVYAAVDLAKPVKSTGETPEQYAQALSHYAQELNDYADFLSFAAGQGQTAGQSAGDLPAGYLPLPASLQAQATAAVTRLRTLAAGGTGPASSPTTTSSSSTATTPSGGPSTGGPATGGSGAGGTGSTTPASPATPSPAVGPSQAPTVAAGTTPTAGPTIVPPTISLESGNTPGQPVGPIRDVLVVVLIVGLAGAGGGIVMRNGRLPRWPGRSRP